MEKWNRYPEPIKWKLLWKLSWSRLELREVKYRLDTFEIKDFSEIDFRLFQKVGIINAVWPSYILRFGKWVWRLSNFIFWLVNYKIHDINYFIGGTEEDKKESDDGLLKYGWLSIVEFFKKLNLWNNIFFAAFLVVFYTLICSIYVILLSPAAFLLFFAYFCVRAFGKKSFNYIYLSWNYERK